LKNDGRETTAEEKLLNVIRRQDKQRQQKEIAESTLSGEAQGRLPVMGLLRFFNGFFMVVSVIFLALVVYRYMMLTREDFNSEEMVAPMVQPSGAGNNQMLWNPDTMDRVSFSGSWSRDLFEAPWEKPQIIVDPVTEPEIVVKKNIDLSSLFRLAGIIIDSQESQVIVEDLAAGEVFFVNQGQEIFGAKLVEIFEDRAVFIYENERVELTP
jgi:type II secretory pathway component PulC